MIKKICISIGSVYCGGAERVGVNIANDLVELGHEVTLLTLDNRESIYEIDNRVHVCAYKIRGNVNKVIHYFRTILFIRKSLKKINPDTVLNFAFPSFFLLSTIGLKYKIAISIRNNPNNLESFDTILLRSIIYKRAFAIIAQTDYAKSVLYRQTKHNNIIVLPNYLREIKSHTIEKCNYIICVGKLNELKGQHKLIKIFSELENENWKLILVGEGLLKEKLMLFSNQLKLAEKVIFTGNIKDVDYYLQQSKIFAFCSQTEGFPNALLEAMSTPLACIAYDCIAGPNEIIQNGIDGFLIPLNDEIQFKNKLQLLMDDELLRDEFCSKSIAVNEKFAKANLLKQINNILLNN